MIKRILGALSLAAVLATTAQAQTYTFSFDGFSNNGSGYTDYNTGAGHFVTTAPTGFTAGSQFKVWCVDELHYVPTNGAPNPYTVYATQLSSGSLAHTRLGMSLGTVTGKQRYTDAAKLAQSMGGTDANRDLQQKAMWAILHGKTLGPTDGLCRAAIGGAYYGGAADHCAHGNTEANLTAAIAASTSQVIDQTKWTVITSINFTNEGVGQSYQEFLTKCQTSCGRNETGQDPTPEPATMSLLALGLAGMAGANARRRRNK